MITVHSRHDSIEWARTSPRIDVGQSHMKDLVQGVRCDPRQGWPRVGTAVAMAAMLSVALSAGTAKTAAALPPNSPASVTPAVSSVKLPKDYKTWHNFAESGCRVWIGAISDKAVSHGDKHVWTYIVVRCAAGRKFQFKSEIWEADPGKDDFVYTLNAGSPYIDPPDNKATAYRLPSNTKNVRLEKSFDFPGRWGEYFQKVRVRVWIAGEPFPEPWTNERNGRIRPIRVT